MSATWRSDDEPREGPIGLAGWCRVVLRGVPLILLVLGGLAILLLVRLLERPLHGLHRPWTPWITQWVCRLSLVLIGLRYRCVGRPMSGPGAVVANHSSWLDIFVLNAAKRVYFVSKDDVAAWPLIGWLARATGTVFIRRNRRQAAQQVAIFRDRLAAGHMLLFFPEGTSSDGLRVLPFKPTLFAAFFDPSLRETTKLQAATVQYRAPHGADPRHYGWWGDMDFGPHLLRTLAARRQGQVTVIYHAPVRLVDFADRKALAQALEVQVRDGLSKAAP